MFVFAFFNVQYCIVRNGYLIELFSHGCHHTHTGWPWSANNYLYIIIIIIISTVWRISWLLRLIFSKSILYHVYIILYLRFYIQFSKRISWLCTNIPSHQVKVEKPINERMRHFTFSLFTISPSQLGHILVTFLRSALTVQSICTEWNHSQQGPENSAKSQFNKATAALHLCGGVRGPLCSSWMYPHLIEALLICESKHINLIMSW